MNDSDRKLLEQMAAHSKELMVGVMEMLVLLSKGEAGAESFRCLGKTYRIESLPDKNEVRIWPVDQ